MTEIEITFEETGPDGSKQHLMKSEIGGKVHYSVFDDELCAHTWECPKEGRIFLRALEDEAKIQGLKLTIPTVMDPRLAKILYDNGYQLHKKFIGPPYNETCELWWKGG